MRSVTFQCVPQRASEYAAETGYLLAVEVSSHLSQCLDVRLTPRPSGNRAGSKWLVLQSERSKIAVRGASHPSAWSPMSSTQFSSQASFTLGLSGSATKPRTQLNGTFKNCCRRWHIERGHMRGRESPRHEHVRVIAIEQDDDNMSLWKKSHIHAGNECACMYHPTLITMCQDMLGSGNWIQQEAACISDEP